MWVYSIFRYHIYLILYENNQSFIIYFGENTALENNINFEIVLKWIKKQLSGGKRQL